MIVPHCLLIMLLLFTDVCWCLWALVPGSHRKSVCSRGPATDAGERCMYTFNYTGFCCLSTCTYLLHGLVYCIQQQPHWTTNFINLCWHQFVLALILVDFVKYKVMWILQIVDINRHLIWWICLTVKSMKIGAQRLMMLLQYLSNVWWIMIVH